jgi:methyl-accepting chemotaxis protein
MTKLQPYANPVPQPAADPRPGGHSPSSPALTPPFAVPQPRRRRLRQQLGIRTLVVTSFVIPIVAAVGTTGWLTIRNGQRAATELATQLHSEITARVEQQLDDFLGTPHLINQINTAGVRLGELDLQNPQQLERHFWQQSQLFPAISYIYLGTETEMFVGAEPAAEGLPNVGFWTGTDPEGNFETYATDDQGYRTEKISVVPGYEMLGRPWYLAAKEAGRPVWGGIYVWVAPSPNIALPAVQPIVNQAGELRGVFAADISLLTIGDFLRNLEVGETGQVFIMERDGLLVASSSADPPFTEANGELTRLSAAQSESPLIQGAVEYLGQEFGSLSQIEQPQQLKFTLEGKPQRLQVTPYQDDFGLDWLIVVAIPEADFMGQINANTWNTIGLCLLALGVATGIGILTSRQITTPIVRLSQASQAIASGQFEQTVDIHGVGEINLLAQSFNQMAGQLQKSFVALEAANQELEQRVEDRTAALNAQTQTLQDEVEQLLTIVSAVEAGDLTVAADVSPSITGLVADTFNQLIERFGQIMATVSGAAKQVNQGAEQVESLATEMADNARQQVESVVQAQTLMENINDLSQSNGQRAADTDQAIADAQRAIDQGQQDIATVTDDIAVLQQETHQIIGRAQTLNSYADLAAQFVKDQKRIASLTRVLAMNASMLSTRASQQQDPAQFAAITRELETIATQVNDLANQTNQSLVVQQQRTEQIQTVVSGLNYDVDIINQRADSLSAGMDQSNQAFGQIKTATSQVAHLSQQVSQSSQAIAAATQTTLQSIREISSIAAKTSDRANLTKDQSQTMEQLARTLLQTVARFQLPAQASGHRQASSPLPAAPGDDFTGPHPDTATDSNAAPPRPDRNHHGPSPG